jgi:hypothetical protein
MGRRASVSRETTVDELDELAGLGDLDQAAELAEQMPGEEAARARTLAELGEAAAAAAAAGEPVVLEFGRYKVYQAPDGGWAIARAVECCERCQDCGCGTQLDAIQIPAMVIKLATMQGGSLRDKLKAMRAAT